MRHPFDILGGPTRWFEVTYEPPVGPFDMLYTAFPSGRPQVGDTATSERTVKRWRWLPFWVWRNWKRETCTHTVTAVEEWFPPGYKVPTDEAYA
jgi:hypothetical protein